MYLFDLKNPYEYVMHNNFFRNVSAIVFKASCNDVPVSGLKIQEILYMLHNTTESPVPLLSYYFGAGVILPVIQEFAPSFAAVSMFLRSTQICPFSTP